jgi:hypothetical protein
MLSPSSGSKNKSRKKPELCFASAFTPISCFPYCSTLKMEAICSSKTSVDFQQATRRYIPEDITFITTAIRTSNPTSLNFLPFLFQADCLAGICCEFLGGLYTPTSNRIFNRIVISSEWLRYGVSHKQDNNSEHESRQVRESASRHRKTELLTAVQIRIVFWAGGPSRAMQGESSSEKLVATYGTTICCKPGSSNMNRVISTYGSLLT